MIVVRTPLRITLGGGGTDLPDNPDGLCVTATINRYIYSVVSQPFTDEYIVHHHQGIERVEEPHQIQHRLLREILSSVEHHPIEFSGVSEIPAGTGLGSSSAFTVGALHAIHGHHGRRFTPEWLAEEACEIEVTQLRDPIGYQDQWATALGGLRGTSFRNGKVATTPIAVPDWQHLSDGLRLFYTGITRTAATQMGKSPPVGLLRSQAVEVIKALESGDMYQFGACLTDQWSYKLQCAPSPTHHTANLHILNGLKQGALGGKLVGAGNGGFLLFYSEKPLDLPLREVPIQLTIVGTERLQ